MEATEKASLVFMQTTVGDRSAAEALAEGVIRTKLAACAQVGGPLTSFYQWQGTMHREREYLVLMKTVPAKQTALAEYICAHHPYTTPEAIAVPISHASQAYLDWAVQACSDG